MTALAADQHPAEWVFAAIFAVSDCLLLCFLASFHFVLYHIEHLLIDDRWVRPFYIVHRSLTVVLFSVFRQHIGLIGLAEDGVACVLFVAEYAVYDAVCPAFLAQLRRYTVCFQSSADAVDGHASKVFTVDAAHDRGFFFINLVDISAFGIFASLHISQHQTCVQHDFAVFELLLVCPLDVGGHRSGLLLGHGCEDGDEHLTARCQCVDVFILEVHANSEVFEFADVVQCIHRVSCKSADGFDQHLIDLTRAAVCDHAHEVWTALCTSTCDTGVSVDTAELPFVLRFDKRGVMLHLSLEAIFLFFLFSGYTGVCCDDHLLYCVCAVYKERCARDFSNYASCCGCCHDHTTSFLFQPGLFPAWPLLYALVIFAPL